MVLSPLWVHPGAPGFTVAAFDLLRLWVPQLIPLISLGALTTSCLLTIFSPVSFDLFSFPCILVTRHVSHPVTPSPSVPQQ